MNSKILLFFLIFLSLNLPAQDSPWYFSLNMGKSWPFGAFSQNSLTELNTGFAQVGFSLSLESNYAVNDNVSFKGIALLNTNSLNRLPLWTNLNNHLAKTITLGANDQGYVSLSVNPWVTNSLLVGPVYTFILNSFKWDFYASAGLVVIYLPQSQLIYQNPTNNWIYINRNTNPRNYNFGLCGGTALRYPISQRFDFRLGVNYFHSQANQRFEEVKITTTQTTSTTQQLSTSQTKVPLNNLFATVGLVYYLK